MTYDRTFEILLPVEQKMQAAAVQGDEIKICFLIDERKIELNYKPNAQRLLSRLDKYRGAMPADFKFDRVEANESI